MSKQNPTDPIMISALQHYSYCPRQCALIHQEQCFDDNAHTVKGQRVHERVDTPESRVEDGVRVIRAMPLYSEKYGLVGKADVVEFHDDGRPFPVEYKHGKRHAKQHDDIQLAAQAVCLEEMIGQPVPQGAIYHHRSHRRRVVDIDAPLRLALTETIDAIRAMLGHDRLPPPTEDRMRCKECSLMDLCQPEVIRAGKQYRRLRATLFQIDEDPCGNS